MKTVLFYLPSDLVGGAEIQTAAIIKGISEYGFKPVVAHAPVWHTAKNFIKELREYAPTFEIVCEEDLLYVINKFKPELIHHFHNQVVYPALKKSKHVCKVIEVVHGRFHFNNDVTKTPKDLTSWVVSVSEDARKFFLDSLPEWGQRTSVITNGVDLKRFNIAAVSRDYEATDRKITFLHMGRLCEGDKRITRIAEICTKLNIRPDKWCLRIVGEGADRIQIETHINKIRAGYNIEMVQHTDSPELEYQNADIYLSRSEAEGFGLSIVEAAASALPIVMWDCGGAASYFKHGTSAFIVKDDLAFARGIEQLVKQPAARAQLGRAAKALADKQFSQEKMVTEYVGLYRRLLNEETPRAIDVALNKRVVGISNPNFSGVSNATKSVVGNSWIGIPPATDMYMINAAISKILALNPELLLIGGGGGYQQLVRQLRARMPKLKTMLVWHGTHSFNSFSNADGKLLAEYIDLLNLKIIDRIGFVRPEIHSVFNNPKMIYFPNRIPGRTAPVKRALGAGTHIGVFGTPYAWKNQQGAALYLGKAFEDSVIHVNHIEDTALLERAGVKIIKHGNLGGGEFKALLSSMSLNAMLSFTESHGLTAMESFRSGVPCIVGSNVKICKSVSEWATVHDLDDPDEIKQVAKRLLHFKDNYVERVNQELDYQDQRNVGIISGVLNSL